MKLESFGTLLYKKNKNKCFVLLVHASGEKNKKEPWSIPKGKKEENESGVEAAVRETLEETGVKIDKELLKNYGYVTYKSKKVVHCYMAKVENSTEAAPASWEVDKVEFVELEKAKEIIHPKQLYFLDKLDLELNN